jgi:hypothetical protein
MLQQAKLRQAEPGQGINVMKVNSAIVLPACVGMCGWEEQKPA